MSDDGIHSRETRKRTRAGPGSRTTDVGVSGCFCRRITSSRLFRGGMFHESSIVVRKTRIPVLELWCRFAMRMPETAVET